MHISSEFCILDEMQDNKTASEKLLKILLLLLLYAQLHCICPALAVIKSTIRLIQSFLRTLVGVMLTLYIV